MVVVVTAVPLKSATNSALLLLCVTGTPPRAPEDGHAHDVGCGRAFLPDTEAVEEKESKGLSRDAMVEI